MLYLLIVTSAYLLGMNHRRITASLTSLVDLLTANLPDTRTDTLGLRSDFAIYYAWATEGEYLIRDNGQWRNVYLSRSARYLMGEYPSDLISLVPARVISGVAAKTPSGGVYTRKRTERTYRVSGLEIACYV